MSETNSDKLDKILFFMGSTEEHFRTLNGSVKRHELKLVETEKRFIKVYEDFQKSCSVCNGQTKKDIDVVEKIALGNKGKLLKWTGIVIGLSIIIPVVSCFATLKVLGII